MSYTLKPGENARHAAQELLGNGMLYHELKSTMWNGNPDQVRSGQTFYLPDEKPGPPARHLLNARQWGRKGLA